MSPVANIGLPHLTSDELEELAEECENRIASYILKTIPSKSISDMAVMCSLDYSDQLNVDIEITLHQDYDTGHDLSQVIEDSTALGTKWLEEKLRGMKRD